MIENRRLRHDYVIIDRWHAGIVLMGSEVKSLRRGCGSLHHAYGCIEGSEVYLINMDIPEYQFSQEKHAPKRKRKLLLQKREIKKMIKSQEAHYTLIPARVYFNDRGYVKIELALCIGKKQFDKRRSLKEKEAARDLDRARKTILLK